MPLQILRRLFPLLPALALLCATQAAAAVIDPNAPPSHSSVPAGVLERMARGVNLSFWFTERDNPTLDPNVWRPNRADFQLIHDLGLCHVRVMVDERFLEDPRHRGTMQPERFAELRRGIDMAVSRDLLVVLALTGAQEWKNRLQKGGAPMDETVKLWTALASGLADISSDHLVFEALNEPGFDDVARSRAIMQQLLGAIRHVAPDHTVVIQGTKFGSVPELLTLVPLEDPNLVYTFHYYEPYNFTHQGADWGYPPWAKFHDFPYPSSPESMAPILPKLDPEARPHAQFYGEQRWNRTKVAEPLDRAAAWARRYGVPLWCGEFGALKPFAPPGARDRWLRDVRELLEARGILWSHFDYADHFGLVAGAQNERVPDRGAIEALGLRVP